MEKSEPPPLTSKRNFLKAIGLSAGGAVLGSLAGRQASARTAAGEAAASARRAVILLHAGGAKTPDQQFLGLCEAYMRAGAERGRTTDLGSVLVRLSHPFQVYFKDVKDAQSWLEQNGYFAGLDYYVRNGGRTVMLFHELDRVTEPQYNVCPRSLAYLSHALRRRYWNGGDRRLYTFFPGPSERLGPNGFGRYFQRYDLLDDRNRPQTFGQYYGENVDPAVRGMTMLNHANRGVFDRVALRYDPSGASFSRGPAPFGAIPQLDWLKASVDTSVFLYQAELPQACKSQFREDGARWVSQRAGRAASPYREGEAHYFVHLAGLG